LERFIGRISNKHHLNEPSSFGATLELAREGYIELRQNEPFGPLYLKWLNKTPEEDALKRLQMVASSLDSSGEATPNLL
jgi:chromatin segregation and condensation protein Rec8/ScpA/Scc1 (kleisin family)